MTHYLSIVLRNQFNLFYRFGYTFIPKTELVDFNGNISDEIKEHIVQKFTTITPFEYDEEYLILHLEKTISEGHIVRFEVQDIVAVYPLSQQAKVSIESKIDQRIKLEEPFFESVLPEIESKIKKVEVEKASSALWTICKIDSPLENFLNDIGLENILKGLEHRKKGTKANKIKSGNFWEYLIAYDYYQYFPEGIIRYFYQLGEVFSYYKDKDTGIEGTKLEDLLKQIEFKKLDEILQKFKDEYLPDSFTKEMKEIGKSKFNPIIVSVLFLKWKTDLNKDIDLLKSSIFYKGKVAFIDKYPNEVKLSLILLGSFWGFRKFYDLYYESLNLRFYKSYKPQTDKITIKGNQEQVTNEKQEDEVSNSIVEIENEKVQYKETQVEKSVNADWKGKDEQEKTDEFSPYFQIIESALKEKSEIKLSDLAKLIKEKTGKKFNNTDIKGIVGKMNEVEICMIGTGKKKAEGVKRNAGLFSNE